MSLLALLSVLTAAMTAAHKPRVSMLIVIGCVLAPFFLGIILIPRFGMIGTASANLLTPSLTINASSVPTKASASYWSVGLGPVSPWPIW